MRQKMFEQIPNDSASALEFRRVSLGFDGRRVLDDISFTLGHNQMIVITGNSESGKSVLLHTAIGLLRPDEGRVLVNGVDLGDLSEAQLLDLRGARMGITFQEDTLFTALTVFDNTAYRLTERGWDDNRIDAAVAEMLRFVGLEGDADKLPEELSVGMRRRLELARALIGYPPLMLFDEPTAGLDPINARMILDLIIRARDIHKISCLLVSKELHQIAYLANHCATSEPGGDVRIQSGFGRQAPVVQVMLLERGRVAFFGDHGEFQSSDVPAVSRFKNTEVVAAAR